MRSNQEYLVTDVANLILLQICWNLYYFPWILTARNYLKTEAISV